MSTLRYIIFSLAVIIHSGCIEHSLKLNVLPEGKAIIDYSMQGDRIDMEDGFELLPDSTIWNSSRHVEEREDETVHVFTSSFTLDSLTQINAALDWTKSSADSIHLTRDMKITINDYFFGKSYTFSCNYQSRNFNQKYGDIWDFIPTECSVLEDDDKVNSMTSSEVEVLEKKYALGLIQWNRYRYEKRFHKVWEMSSK